MTAIALPLSPAQAIDGETPAAEQQPATARANSRPHHSRGLIRLRTYCLILAAMLGFGLFGASTANADTVLASVRFSPAVSCSIQPGVDGLRVFLTTNSHADSYVSIWLQRVGTTTWVSENQWHPVNIGSTTAIHDVFTFTGHAYYRVYLQYAQRVTGGFIYGGELINSYGQRNIYGYASPSTSCYI